MDMEAKHLNKRSRRYSIKARIALAITALVVAQGIIFLCAITASGVISKNNIATYSILSNQSSSGRSDIQDTLNNYRKNMVYASQLVCDNIEAALGTGNRPVDGHAVDDAVFDEILSRSLDELIDFTKYNSVTGVFVVLDPSAGVGDKSKESRPSMYVRDSSPTSMFENNSNLLLEYGKVDIARRKGIAVDYLWTQDMDFSDSYNKDFYFKPVMAALESGASSTNPQTYGYWSPKFTMRKDDVPVITYSLPLILKDGTVFGVMGFDLETMYISKLMKATDIPYDNGFNILSADTGEGVYNDTCIFSGAFAYRFLYGNKARLDFSFIYEEKGSVVYKIVNPNIPSMVAIGAYSVIELYEKASPFIDEEWALICTAPYSSIMSSSNSIRDSIAVSIISTLVIALILSVFIVLFIANPINWLSAEVKSINPKKPVRFKKTNITEIDELSGAFEILSDRVSDAAQRMFKIIELVDMPLGSFETDHSEDSARLSKSLFDILEIEKPSDGSTIIPLGIWTDFLKTLEVSRLTQTEEGVTEALYVTKATEGAKKWFRVRVITERTRDIGVLIDATDEIMQMQRLEYERNYDPLTKLLNRNAFISRSVEIIKAQSDMTGITMFADLDELKFMNDTYGHEFGDKYIKAFSEFLNRFKEIDAAVGRISGDEFVMFMCGFGSREEARQSFDGIISGLGDVSITTNDGVAHKVRVSIGLSYFPDDSRDINELLKFADFAMYEVKHTRKGDIKEFDFADYSKNSFVLEMKEILDNLIDERKIRFAFQPIIDVATGEIFAYEALMRSMIEELKTPTEILAVARSQSKLYQLEKLSFEVLFYWLQNNSEQIKDKKLFVNTIPGEMFSESDYNKISRDFGDLLGGAVFEITENEFLNKEDALKKIAEFRRLGSMIAIDNYGSGYSNELALMSIKPDFIKIDMDIIRDIDKDADKQQLVQSAITSARKKSIKTIASGVETAEEANMLIGFGIDCIQGFFLAEPGFELSHDAEKKISRAFKASIGNQNA